MAQVQSDDEETQQKGLVCILVVEKEAFSYLSKDDAQREHGELMTSYPVRLGSAHVCLPPGPLFTFLRSILVFGLADSYARVRVKVHTDVGIATQYSLSSVGIPVSEIPLTSNKAIKVKNHHQWIRNRHVFENENANGIDSNRLVEHPRNHDVLFRQGGHTMRQGNMEFLHLLEPHLDPYFAACPKEANQSIHHSPNIGKGMSFLGI